MKHRTLQLDDYHVWANNKVFERLKELTNSVYTQEIQSVFPSTVKALTHICKSDTIYLGVMRENSIDEIQASIIQAQEKTKDNQPEEIAI